MSIYAIKIVFLVNQTTIRNSILYSVSDSISRLDLNISRLTHYLKRNSFLKT